MQSSYKRLGDYIREVNIRNKDLNDYPLLGVSVKKVFMPSIANTVGTDFSTYKVVMRNQFTYIPDTSRRGEKIGLAFLDSFDFGLVSQAYTVFKIIDEYELHPEYLMMWFKRPEFDRYARVKSHGSVREIFDWQEMCDVLLPIPSPEKQLEIVREYNVIQNRIQLNNQLIAKLEETAQAIYKQWFVDFEFPDENGLPYKSNGGEMVESELGEIPKGWRFEKFGFLVQSFSKKHNFKKSKLIFFNTSDILDGEFLHSNYSNVATMPGQAKKQIQKGDILFSEIRPINKRFALVRRESDDYVVSTKLMVLRKKSSDVSVYRLYHYLTDYSLLQELQKSAEGRSGTFPQITFEEDLECKNFLLADEKIERLWDKFLNAYYMKLFTAKDQRSLLKELKVLVLAKMTKVEMEKELA